jgi:hypothetical protein
MPGLNPDALTTLDTAELYLARTGGTGPAETEDDALIALYVNAASAAAQAYIERTLAPQEAAVTKRYRYEGGGFLNLEPWELRTVTGMTLYSDLPTTSQVALTAQSGTVESQWRLEPRQGSRLGTYMYVSLPRLAPRGIGWGGQEREVLGFTGASTVAGEIAGYEVAITGDWGAPYIPGDVELAVLVAVDNWYQNPAGFQRALMEGVEADQYPQALAEALPPASRALLTPYRR